MIESNPTQGILSLLPEAPYLIHLPMTSNKSKISMGLFEKIKQLLQPAEKESDNSVKYLITGLGNIAGNMNIPATILGLTY